MTPCARGRLTFESFGVVVRVDCDDREVLESFARMLPPGWAPVDTEPAVRFGLTNGGSVTKNGVEVAREADREPAAQRLGSVVRHHLAVAAPGYVFVHAGAVERGGRAIVIPGDSFSGKTTLVAELLRQGANYLSDEYAVVDSHGMVHPFAQPLSIRSGDSGGARVLVAPAVRRVVNTPVPSLCVLLTAYRSGARWSPAVWSAGEGAFGLLRFILSARRRPAQALKAARDLTAGALVLAGERGEAAETVSALLNRMAGC